MDLNTLFLGAILAAQLGALYRLGQLNQGFKDLHRRVELLEGTNHELASKAA